MLTDKLKTKVENILNDKIQSTGPVSGGCISDAYKISCQSGKNYFLKLSSNLPEDMFPKEANGLSELKKSDAIRVPGVIYKDASIIILEFIQSLGRSKKFFEDFGRKFAELHKFTSQRFGFFEDNYIGATPQLNIANDSEKDNWINFYFNKRILYQFHLAEKNRYSTEELSDGIKKLENKIQEILSGIEEAPSLLHGDLWSGNFISDEKGNVCLIDPAVYYGHREADLAMTKLFGGFDKKFYDAYKETYPLKDGYKYRENIYKLYHVLNHLNLFGSGYYSQAISLIRYYL
ncbi:MAG TPA: fructosamine kinase family protein [Ignavibacteriaceae bacterium]|nr:fructosamine kinase family protein [Ignavibacteriaceae bacterium]